MKVTFHHGAMASFAVITTSDKFVSVLLKPGLEPAEALRHEAADQRRQAARLIARAQVIEQAADHLDPQPEACKHGTPFRYRCDDCEGDSPC